MLASLAMAQMQQQEFPPGYSAKQKLAWGKENWENYCKNHPMPDALKGMSTDSLTKDAKDFIDGLTMQAAIDLIKKNCGSQTNVTAANTN